MPHYKTPIIPTLTRIKKQFLALTPGCLISIPMLSSDLQLGLPKCVFAISATVKILKHSCLFFILGICLTNSMA